MSAAPHDELVVDPERFRVYAEGWQSWSPTRLSGPRDVAPVPASGWELAMRFRPDRPPVPGAFQGEGLLVVDPGTGAPVVRYGADGTRLDAVPTIRAEHRDGRLLVGVDGDVTTTSHPDLVTALTGFGTEVATRSGTAPLRPAPRVWCSWYQYFEAVTAADVEENLMQIDRLGLEVDVVQVDDGWSDGLGEGGAPRRSFDLVRLVDRVRSGGRRLGIWLAPFLVGAGTSLARRHPDWLVGYAGHNWGQDLLGLDLTHPAVREHLHATISGLRDLGVGYLKLDFLYGGAVPGTRHLDVTPLAAYRSGLKLVREAAGPETFLLGCGAPILPSVGLVDGMRVSPDTFHAGGEDGSRGLRGRVGAAARAWQQGRFWVNDADCLVARRSYALREPWAETVETFGGLRSSSDRLADLDDWGLETTRRLLAGAPGPEPFTDRVVRAGLATAADAGALEELEEGRP